MKVTIVSPEKTLFEGEVEGVKLPGAKGRFEVLKDMPRSFLRSPKEQ